MCPKRARIGAATKQLMEQFIYATQGGPSGPPDAGLKPRATSLKREIVSLCAVPTPPPPLRDTSACGGQKVVPLWRGQGEVSQTDENRGGGKTAHGTVYLCNVGWTFRSAKCGSKAPRYIVEA